MKKRSSSHSDFQIYGSLIGRTMFCTSNLPPLHSPYLLHKSLDHYILIIFPTYVISQKVFIIINGIWREKCELRNGIGHGNFGGKEHSLMQQIRWNYYSNCDAQRERKRGGDLVGTRRANREVCRLFPCICTRQSCGDQENGQLSFLLSFDVFIFLSIFFLSRCLSSSLFYPFSLACFFAVSYNLFPYFFFSSILSIFSFSFQSSFPQFSSFVYSCFSLTFLPSFLSDLLCDSA